MRKTLRWSMAAVMAASLVGVTALAQQPGRGGGFGGGMFGGGPALLVRSKTVLSEIKATDEQAKKLADWSKEFATKTREAMQEKLKDVPMEERFQKMGAILSELNQEAYKDLGSVLKEDQIKRLKQIDVQLAGLLAFVRKDVQEALKLTDDQQAKMKDIQGAAQKEQRDLRQEYGLGFGGGQKGGFDQAKMQEFQKKSAAINNDALTKITEILTDDQKKTWKDLTGEKVDADKIRRESTPQFGRKKDD